MLERLHATSVDEVVIVEGAYSLEAARDNVPPAPPLRIVSCAGWKRGPGASLRCGVEVLGADVEAAVVVLADGPNLAPAAVERVLTEWRRSGGVVAAAYDGGRGHPLVLGRDDWADIPDEGLRDMPVTLVPCDDLGTPGDVDTTEDLERL